MGTTFVIINHVNDKGYGVSVTMFGNEIKCTLNHTENGAV